MQNNSSMLKSSVMMKPFSFVLPQNGEFNQVLLDSVDVDSIRNAVDLNQYTAVLKNFIQAKLTPDNINQLSYENFNKLLQLCQITMDYYTQNQEQKEKIISSKLEGLQQKQDIMAKLAEKQKEQDLKRSQLKKESEKLKKEYQQIKEKGIQNVYFKCHICSEVMQNREKMTHHIDSLHSKAQEKDKAINQFSNPQYLMKLLTQLQQPQQVASNSQQSFNSPNFVNTGQSWGLGEVSNLGSKALEELQNKQEEKVKRREDRKKERELRREQEKQERMEKFKQQQKMMQDMQAGIEQMMEAKINELRFMNEDLQSQQLLLREDNMKIMGTLSQKHFPKNSGRTHSQETQELKTQRDEEQNLVDSAPKATIDTDKNLIQQIQQNLEISHQSDHISEDSINQYQSSKHEISQEQSGIMSFHNYSYSNPDRSFMQIKNASNEPNSKMMKDSVIGSFQGKQFSNMQHIGDLESDYEQDFENKSNTMKSNFNPNHKKTEIYREEEQLASLILNKKRQIKDEQMNEMDFEQKRQIFEQEKSKIGFPPSSQFSAMEQKDLQSYLKQAQDKNLKQSAK